MRIALITGASSGIGKWFALYTACYRKRIDELWLVARNKKNLKTVGEKITEHTGIPCRIVPADLTSKDDMLSLEHLLIRQDPEISLLVNCAGYGMIGSFKRMALRDLSGMNRLNCEALTVLTKICLPYLHRGSMVINIASAAAFLPQSDFAVYAATKSYVLSLSRALGKELKKSGIRVMAVCPGCINTPFFDRAEQYQGMKSFKKLFMANPRAVVRKAIMDAAAGKRTSIYGVPIQFLYWVSKWLPDAVLRLFY